MKLQKRLGMDLLMSLILNFHDRVDDKALASAITMTRDYVEGLTTYKEASNQIGKLLGVEPIELELTNGGT